MEDPCLYQKCSYRIDNIFECEDIFFMTCNSSASMNKCAHLCVPVFMASVRFMSSPVGDGHVGRVVDA